jgi:hypothetical protein
LKRKAAAILAPTILALAWLAGCEREREAPEPPRPAPTATPTSPLSFERKTADAEVALTLPAALQAHPALHKRLYDRESAALTAFAEEAAGERAALGDVIPPYTQTVVWRVSAETPRLLSLVREADVYSGGAHPNASTESLLWDKSAGRELAPDAWLPAAARPALEATLCDALKVEKAKRGGVQPGGEVWPCPKLADVTVALAPGDAKPSAGGLVALIDPYVAGPYAEGGYEISLPVEPVRAAVAPAYRDQFAG